MQPLQYVVGAVLRPGTGPAKHGALAILRRLLAERGLFLAAGSLLIDPPLVTDLLGLLPLVAALTAQKLPSAGPGCRAAVL